MRDDAAKRGFLVPYKRLAEVNAVLEARQQYLSERDSAHRTMLRHALAPEARWRIASVEREQHFHLLGNETDAIRRLAASPRKRFEQRRWQAFVQREAAGRIDMHAITLHAVGAGTVAFIDGGADPGFFQALRQREATNATTDDDDVERCPGRVANGAAI